MTLRLTYLGAAAVLAAALSSCGGNPDPIWQQAFGYQCGADANSSNAMCHRGVPGEGQAVVSRYCYSTIAGVNCFDRPDPDRKNEALGDPRL